MKESRRAARDEDAHRRLIAAAEKLSTDTEKIADLKAVRQRRLAPETAAMMEREILADILEGVEEGTVAPTSGEERRRVTLFAQRLELPPAQDHTEDEPGEEPAAQQAETEQRSQQRAAQHTDLTFLSDQQVHALSEAGYDTVPALYEATDEELEAVSHIGTATVKKIRAAFADAEHSEVKGS